MVDEANMTGVTPAGQCLVAICFFVPGELALGDVQVARVAIRPVLHNAVALQCPGNGWGAVYERVRQQTLGNPLPVCNHVGLLVIERQPPRRCFGGHHHEHGTVARTLLRGLEVFHAERRVQDSLIRVTVVRRACALFFVTRRSRRRRRRCWAIA